MPIPDNTRRLLHRRLRLRAEERWPELADVAVRFRGTYAYVEGIIKHGDTLPLCRLRHLGSASDWAFAVYLASNDGYEISVLPRGTVTGAPRRSPGLRLRSLPQRSDRVALTNPHEFPTDTTK